MIESKMYISRQRGVTGHYRQGKLVFEIDTKVARFKGRKIKDLSAYDKRKFDNALYLENAYEKKPIKMLYGS